MRQLVTMCAAVFVLATAPLHAQHLGARLQWQPEIADLDSRLQQKVAIEILGRAAVPALKLLSDAAGVSLTVAPEDLDTVGERKLTIISKGLTLKAIMVQLPEALQECHWDIDSSGDEPLYLLHRNAGVEASIQREQQEQRAEFEEQQRQQRLDSIDDARRALAMSPEELEELEKTDILLARAAQHPLTRELMDAYASLPEESLDELMQTGRLRFRYEECPPVVRRLAKTALEVQSLYLSFAETHGSPHTEKIAQSQEQIRNVQEQIATGAVDGLIIRVRDLGGRAMPGGSLVTVSGSNRQLGAPMVPGRYPWSSSPGNPHECLLVETGDTIEDAREAVARAREEGSRHSYQLLSGESDWTEPSDPRLHEHVDIPLQGDKGYEYISCLDIQRCVAAETGLSVISDYFTGHRVRGIPREPPLGDSLWRDLYILGRTGGFTWRLTGDCLIFHCNQWHQYAQRELPESLLVKYRQRLAQQGSFTLDDATEFALELEARPSHPGPTGFAIPRDLEQAGLGHGRGYGVLSPLLFYGSLTPEEQSRARSPQGLALAELFANGRRDILRYVPVGGRTLDKSARRELARRAVFCLSESAGERRGASYTEYVFTFTFPEDADVPEHVVRSLMCLPEIAPAERAGDSPDVSEEGALP